jgi:hypothetical protein
MTTGIECASCHHQIDAEARLCPYCGADPRTGERFDPKPLLEKHFPRREEMSRGESMLEFFRERQSMVVTVFVALLFLGVVTLHRFITNRNAAAVSDVPAIPLTEVADLSNRTSETEPARIPTIEFQSSGSADAFKTLHVEPGAVTPTTPPDLSVESPVLNQFTSPRSRPSEATSSSRQTASATPDAGSAYTAPPPSSQPVEVLPVEDTSSDTELLAPVEPESDTPLPE